MLVSFDCVINIFRACAHENMCRWNMRFLEGTSPSMLQNGSVEVNHLVWHRFLIVLHFEWLPDLPHTHINIRFRELLVPKDMHRVRVFILSAGALVLGTARCSGW